jgi:hypothetical protein
MANDRLKLVESLIKGLRPPAQSPVPEFRDHFAGRKSADLSVNPPTSDLTITLNPVGMYSLYTVVRVDTKYISEFTVSQNVSYIFKNLAKFP